MRTATQPDESRQRELTIAQRNAIDLLIAGRTDQEVAQAVGVTRQTVNGWRNQNPWFSAALNRARAALWGEGADRLRALVPLAFDALTAELTGGANRARVALDLLRLVGVERLDLGAVGPRSAADFIAQAARARRPPRPDPYSEFLPEFWQDAPLTADELVAAEAEIVRSLVGLEAADSV